MAIIGKKVSEAIFSKFLDGLPDDLIFSGISDFSVIAQEAGGQVMFLENGGYSIHFNNEQDMLIFLLKWR